MRTTRVADRAPVVPAAARPGLVPFLGWHCAAGTTWDTPNPPRVSESTCRASRLAGALEHDCILVDGAPQVLGFMDRRLSGLMAGSFLSRKSVAYDPELAQAVDETLDIAERRCHSVPDAEDGLFPGPVHDACRARPGRAGSLERHPGAWDPGRGTSGIQHLVWRLRSNYARL